MRLITDIIMVYRFINKLINSKNEIQKGQENLYELKNHMGFFMYGLLSKKDV